MHASQQRYKSLVDEVYEKKVKGCPECRGVNPDCVCMKQFQLLCDTATSNIPYQFRYAHLNQFQTIGLKDQEKQQAEKYIRNLKEIKEKKCGLWISGDPQSGKTLVTCAILRGALEQGFSAYYLNLNEFYQIHEMKFTDRSETFHKKLQKMHSVDFFALDGLELGIHGAKQATKAALAQIIDERTKADNITIISTALKDPAQLSQITPELGTIVRTACPLQLELVESQFVNDEIQRKQNFFNALK